MKNRKFWWYGKRVYAYLVSQWIFLKFILCSLNGKNSSDEFKSWRSSFVQLVKLSPGRKYVANSFLSSQLVSLKKTELKYNPKLTLICVVKDDLIRLKMLYAHHRAMGVNHFVVIDNQSSDGTKEWLIRQPDTDVYLAKDQFTSSRKYGWINRILCIYGFDKWYLYVDSDELFVYDNYEKLSITEFTEMLQKKKKNRVASMMLDMYTKDALFTKAVDTNDIQKNFKYFDSEGFITGSGRRGLTISGGPRMRVLGEDGKLNNTLIKHPLFFFEHGMIFESAHYLFPYKIEPEINAALLHYKFLASDLERYRERAYQGNFANGSAAYKEYLKGYANNQERAFYYEKSVEFTGSESLKKISIIKPINNIAV